MKRSEHFVYLWGNGGYYALQRHQDGTLTIPEGQKAWESFARFAPKPLLLAALQTLQQGGARL
jgi:hypothetical protein